MSIRIFISHSSRLPRGRELSSLLYTRLEEMGYFPKVDLHSIEYNDWWRSLINSWIANCEAAIILLDSAAIESPWVLYEATILNYERSLHEKQPGRGLVVLPVLDGITQQMLTETPFEPLALDQRQLVQLGNDEDLQASVEKIIKSFKSIEPDPSQRPLDKQAAYLSDLMPGITKTKFVAAADAIRSMELDVLPPLHHAWAPRDPDADNSEGRMAANWLLSNALVRFPGERVRSASAIVLDHLQPDLDETNNEKLIDTLFSGWFPTHLTGKLVRFQNVYLTGGSVDLPLAQPASGRRCFWAAVIRSPMAPNPRNQTPWINLVGPSGFEDSLDSSGKPIDDVETFRQTLEQAWRQKFDTDATRDVSLGAYTDGLHPVGIGLLGDERIRYLVDRLSVDDASDDDQPSGPSAVLAELSYVLLWGDQSPPESKPDLFDEVKGLFVPNEDHHQPQEAITGVDFEYQIEQLVTDVRKALGIQPPSESVLSPSESVPSPSPTNPYLEASPR